MLLYNQVAIVTGAGKGIGKAIALKLAEEGAAVVLTGRNIVNLQEVEQQIEKSGGLAMSIVLDVTKEAEVHQMVEMVITKFQHIDILINNAGISKEMPLDEMPMKIWDEIINTNLRSVVLLTKAVLPFMKRQTRGNIVNIGSGAALRGLPGSSAYSASKAAVVCLTQALGDELRQDGIRVNAVCPGPVDTELFQKSAKREYILQSGGDIFEPETIANGVLYLATDLSKGMSSQVLTIRGFNRW